MTTGTSVLPMQTGSSSGLQKNKSHLSQNAALDLLLVRSLN
jgi:hypothetical protein